MSEVIQLDGKIGGGSVLRVGVPLAIATGRPIHVTNARHQRSRKGLQIQHLTGINLLAQITGSQLWGATVGSSDLKVQPGKQRPPPRTFPKIQVPTAAAVSLIIQTLSNFAFVTRHPVGFEFSGGGSHVSFSPNWDVMTLVNKPLFEMFGLKMYLQLVQPGFYPKGGAIGRVYLEPVEFGKIILTSDENPTVDLVSNASSSLQPQQVAERQINGFKSILSDVRNESFGYANAISPGSALSAIISYGTGTIKSVARIGEVRLNPEDLGMRTAKAAKVEMGHPGAVDEQLADQLLLPLAVSPKGSSYTFKEIYPHVRTNLAVIKQLIGNVLKVEELDGHFRVTRI